jgi:hypothetical protein
MQQLSQDLKVFIATEHNECKRNVRRVKDSTKRLGEAYQRMQKQMKLIGS